LQRNPNFTRTSRDANFVEIEATHKAGKSLTNLWVEYQARTALPYAYKTFTWRRIAWIAPGSKDYWSRLELAIERKAVAPIAVVSGLAFLYTPGIALQVRRGALCVRFADGTERHFRPGEHTISAIIIAASASITTEALAWAAGEHVSVLVMHRNGQALNMLADGLAARLARRELARVHQLNSIFAIFRVSDHDKPLVLKGRCL
jgi:hypothetical protein